MLATKWAGDHFLRFQDVDQQTGEDLNPNRRRNLDPGVGDEAMRNPDRPVEASMVEPEENPSERKRLAKITDLEKWEIKQVSCPHIAVKVLILPRRGVVCGVSSNNWDKNIRCPVQMIAANVLPKEEFPEFDEETGILPKIDDDEGKNLFSSLNFC